MAKPTKDLIRGASDPSTIQTYKTKSFSHEGVTGSTPVKRLKETNVNQAITPQVMRENNSAVGHVVKDSVKSRGRGDGMPADSGKVKNQKAMKSQSGGTQGKGSNVNHA